MRLYSVLVNVVFSVALASPLLHAKEEDIGGDGYNKTYSDESKSFKDRMKEARTTPVVTVANTHGGYTLGVIGDFGPIYDAEPKSSSGMGFGFGVEPGFVIQSESWTRVEMGAEIAYHMFSWKSSSGVDSSISPLSFVPHVGLGHSLGNNLFGIIRLGFGMATGQVKSKSQGVTATSDNNIGYVLSGSYDATYGVDAQQFFGGLGVTHYRYSFSEATRGGVTSSIDESLNLNHVNLHAGLRFKF
jgi:hypothetical protein